jgi:hypothetical protein
VHARRSYECRAFLACQAERVGQALHRLTLSGTVDAAFEGANPTRTHPGLLSKGLLGEFGGKAIAA